jgi:PBP1b-binding outer membrane lipoprotein LpoB
LHKTYFVTFVNFLNHALSFPQAREAKFDLNDHVGAVIGKHGAIINEIQEESGASIRIDKSSLGKTCTIRGAADQVEAATLAIRAIMHGKTRGCAAELAKMSHYKSSRPKTTADVEKMVAAGMIDSVMGDHIVSSIKRKAKEAATEDSTLTRTPHSSRGGMAKPKPPADVISSITRKVKDSWLGRFFATEEETAKPKTPDKPKTPADVEKMVAAGMIDSVMGDHIISSIKRKAKEAATEESTRTRTPHSSRGGVAKPKTPADVKQMVAAGMIDSVMGDHIISSIRRKAKEAATPTRSGGSAAKAKMKSGVSFGSDEKEAKETAPKTPKTPADVDKMVAAGLIDSDMGAMIKSSLRKAKAGVAVPGKIQKVDLKRMTGFVDIGTKQEAYFKFDVCYKGPKVGEFVQAVVLTKGKKSWCTSVTKDFRMEELRNAADRVYDMTGGAVSVDPAKLSPTAASDLIHKVMTMTKAERARRKKAIAGKMKELKNASSAQISFLMDCTGSMGGHLAAAKAGITTIKTNVEKEAPGDAHLTFAFVGYKDFGDGEVAVQDFTDDTTTFGSVVGSVSANGGGDECEDVYGGLEKVASLSWGKQIGTKILFHIADAPTHGSFFAKRYVYGDNSKDFDRDGQLTQEILVKLERAGVQYIFLRINDRTNDMIDTYNELLARSGSDSTIATENLGEAGAIVEIAVKTTVDSISLAHSATTASLAAASSSTGGSTSYLESIVEEVTRAEAASSLGMESEESTVKRSSGGGTKMSEELVVGGCGGKSVGHLTESGISVRVFSVEFPTEMRDIKHTLRLRDGGKAKGRSFKYDDAAVFDKGGVREVSRAEDVTFPESLHYVLKAHMIRPDNLILERAEVITDLMVQSVAAFLAVEFSKSSKVPKKVKYLKTKGIQYLSKKDNKMRFGSIEGVLEGDFVKWCNNGKYHKGADDPAFSATLEAFPHWTYQATKGYLMVTDIQGIPTHTGDFILTDPAIHCVAEERFGSTNIGQTGMNNFFVDHKCTPICTALKLEMHPKQKHKAALIKGTGAVV